MVGNIWSGCQRMQRTCARGNGKGIQRERTGSYAHLSNPVKAMGKPSGQTGQVGPHMGSSGHGTPWPLWPWHFGPMLSILWVLAISAHAVGLVLSFCSWRVWSRTSSLCQVLCHGLEDPTHQALCPAIHWLFHGSPLVSTLEEYTIDNGSCHGVKTLQRWEISHSVLAALLFSFRGSKNRADIWRAPDTQGFLAKVCQCLLAHLLCGLFQGEVSILVPHMEGQWVTRTESASPHCHFTFSVLFPILISTWLCWISIFRFWWNGKLYGYFALRPEGLVLEEFVSPDCEDVAGGNFMSSQWHFDFSVPVCCQLPRVSVDIAD